MIIKGKVAVVTGAGKKGRVGHGLALALAKKGASVLIHYGFDKEKDEAEEVAKEIRELGVRAEIYNADLSSEDIGEKITSIAEEKLGTPEILINSASGFPEDDLLSVDRDKLVSTLNVTLFAPIFLTQSFAKNLERKNIKEGVVVNITDRRMDRPYKNHFSYSIGKGGINQFTKTAAVELGPLVRVNAVALGAILPPPGQDEKYLDDLVASQPLPRAGGVESVAKAMISLIENDFMTGEIVRIDGGAHLV